MFIIFLLTNSVPSDIIEVQKEKELYKMNNKAKELVDKAVEILVENYKNQNVPQYLLANIDNAMFNAEEYINNKYNMPCLYRYRAWKVLYDMITDLFIKKVSQFD